MKLGSGLKKAFGKATFSKIRHVRYLSWEDAFDVEFEDGLCFLESNKKIQKKYKISPKTVPKEVRIDQELKSHFIITYENGQKAEISWEYVRELSD